MKKFRYITLAVVFTTLCAGVQAQRGELKLGLNYNAAIPTASFKDKIEETSLRGWRADILYGISDKISVGLGVGFQDFYQKNPRQVYRGVDGSHISAVLTHSIQTIPILAMGRYNFNPQAAIQPYAALGIGGNLIMFRELLGEFGGTQTKFGFAARPEAGVYIPFSRTGMTGLTLGASYNFMPYSNNDFNNLNSIGIHAGISFPMRR